MSFEMKYDKNGYPIPSKSTYKEQPQEIAPVENLVENQTSLKTNLVENPTSLETVSDNLSPAETQDNNIQAQEQIQTQTSETSQAKNFRQLREKAEKAERERDELIRILKQAQQQPKQQESEEDNEINLGADDLAEGKHLSKLEKKYKKLEQSVKQYEEASNQRIIENKIATQYPDFDKVVSRDNLDMLNASFPEIAYTLNSSPDLYSKAVTAYTLIKKLGINNEDMIDMERAKIATNSAKPRPVSSVKPQSSNTPLSQANPFANGLTKELKEQLRQEIESSRKRR